jgi:hypothetical protein
MQDPQRTDSAYPSNSTDSSIPAHSQQKPHPCSYDSSDECSLDHWLEVYWLVEEEYLFAKDADSEVSI